MTFTKDDAEEIRKSLILYLQSRAEHDTKDSIYFANELAEGLPRALTALEEAWLENIRLQLECEQETIRCDMLANKIGYADLERQLADARKRIGWWEQLWEMARNADPGLHERLRDRFEAEEA